EGGHALFMMYMPEVLHKNHLASEPSAAMHETISRFYENVIGRSRAFCEVLLPILRKHSPEYASVTPAELYESVTRSKPSFIRTEADELTYCAHIAVRYEIEKAFMNGDISIEDVPAVWRDKYREYLCVDVPDDRRGCLQDVHWCDAFGYFPSYAIGSAYGVQILHRMNADFPVWGSIRSDGLRQVTAWMKENVFPYGHLDPDDWILKVTGEQFKPEYFTDYLLRKYS
ncbi:MAG: carboxypeptidase M32, partial [Clostridia bacterium]|nr:carboxypeptidase M32 [Clostridia bacterium]